MTRSWQPTRLEELNPTVREAAVDIAARCMADDASAVVLTGSHAGANPQPESDIDLYALGQGPHYRLEMIRGQMASVSWREIDEVRGAFDDPGAVGALVPGWRRAIIVADTAGHAAELQRTAREWDWSIIGDLRLNAWVAEEVIGYAEEILKLVSARRRGDVATAAVQGAIVAIALAPRLAVHLRLLYETENGLWGRVAERMPSAWAMAQRAALGLGDESLDRRLDAAIRLFALTVTAVRPLMDERQTAVCDNALKLAASPALSSPQSVSSTAMGGRAATHQSTERQE